MIYIFIFVITTFLLYFSELYFRKSKFIGITLAFISIILLSVFAGIRDTSIGTDVEYYLVGHFNEAVHYSNGIWKFITSMRKVNETEPFYAVLLYICGHLFHDIHMLMFLISFITNSFIYLGLKQKSKIINIPSGWLIYCFLYFNFSLNILRQSCAVAIIFYLVMAFSEKRINFIYCIILYLFASGFHRTALIFTPILIALIWGFQNGKLLITKFGAIVVCIFPLFFHLSSNVLASLNFLPIKYRIYFTKMNSSQSSILFDAIIFLLPTGVLFWILNNLHNKVQKRELDFFFISGVTSVICCLFSNLLISRISYYFSIFFCFSVPYSSILISKKNESRLMYLVIMCLWFSLFWYVNIIYFGYGDTYPYLMK